jgi:glycosyltransferase involved in cell wall biosynthesis
VTLVSVIIPTFDRPVLVRQAIASALAQTHREIEVIVVLNGAAAEVAEQVRRCGAQPRVRVVETERANLAAARNYGMSLARGEWIAFLDDDDVWLPEKIEVQLAAAGAAGADLITCNYVQFDAGGDIAGTGLPAMPDGLSYAEALMLGNYLSGGSSAMVRAVAIRSLGGFDPRLVGCEDWDMWRRMAWENKLCRVDRVLVKYRRHGSNMTGDPALTLQAQTRHFSKILEDTPERLRHMLPAAELQFLAFLTNHLSARGLRLPRSGSERVADGIAMLIRAAIDVADKLSFGMVRARKTPQSAAKNSAG